MKNAALWRPEIGRRRRLRQRRLAGVMKKMEKDQTRFPSIVLFFNF
jgi:hypothetical protein